MGLEKIWKPHKRQVDFFQLPDTVFEALYGGAAGGGKSEALLMLPIVRGFYKLPRFKGIIFRRTFPELESEIILRSHEWYPATGATYNSDKRRWTWPSGAIMQFGHCEYEQDIRKYDTAEYNYAAFDELTSFTEFQYLYFTRTRVRTSVPGLPTIVRNGTNPGNVGHKWVRKHFIECGPANVLYRDTVSGICKVFIPCLAKDNPHIDPGYVQRMQGLPEAERRAKAEGDWYTFEGQVFDDWRDDHFPNEPENACHVVDDFAIPDWWPKILALDWGFAAMTYGLWGALDPNGRLFLYREYSRQRAKISEWTADVKSLCQERIDAAVICKSSWQNRGEELLIADQFHKVVGIKPEQPENNRIAGKLAIQDYLRWRPKPRPQKTDGFNLETASKILRTQGTKAFDLYRAQFDEPEEEKHIPKLQVFRSLSLLRETIPLCIYAQNKGATGKPSEDVAEFPGDDPYDTLRYMVLRANKMKAPGSKAANLEKLGQIYADLEKTGDQTAFHRRMESVQTKLAKPVRIYTRPGSRPFGLRGRN